MTKHMENIWLWWESEAHSLAVNLRGCASDTGDDILRGLVWGRDVPHRYIIVFVIANWLFSSGSNFHTERGTKDRKTRGDDGRHRRFLVHHYHRQAGKERGLKAGVIGLVVGG